MRPTNLLRRSATLAVLAAVATCASVLVAAPGLADQGVLDRATSAAAPSSGTITYIKQNNVYVANADGSKPRQLTRNGTAAKPWRSPTGSDDGHIVAGLGNLIYRMDQWGTVLTVLDPPDLQNSAGEWLSGGPAHLAVSPDGKKIAYTYEKFSCPINLACKIRYVTAFTSSTSVTDPTTWGLSYDDNPSWITNTRVAVNADLIDNINLFDLGRGPTHWFDEDDYTTDDEPLFDFEVARNANYATAIRNSGDRAQVVFFRVSGNYRDGGRPPIPVDFCATSRGVGISVPTLSGDGEWGAWQEPDGVWLAAMGSVAPCTTQPTLAIPGGSAPSYTLANLQATRPSYPIKRFSVRKAPRIVGTAKLGKRLSVRAPATSPAPARLRYQWLRDNRAIKKATSSRYRISAKDRGHRLTVRVTVSRPGYRTLTAASRAVRVKP